MKKLLEVLGSLAFAAVQTYQLYLAYKSDQERKEYEREKEMGHSATVYLGRIAVAVEKIERRRPMKIRASKINGLATEQPNMRQEEKEESLESGSLTGS